MGCSGLIQSVKIYCICLVVKTNVNLYLLRGFMFKHAVKVVVDGKREVHSQLVHLQGQTVFKIYLDAWSCTVRFLDDSGASRYAGNVVDNHLYVDLYNHNNSIGESIFTPFAVAGSDGKNIYMTYKTNLIDPVIKVRSFEFVLWMDEQ